MTRPGLILDERYRLDTRIAAGGVGQVWRATDLLLRRPVAVKVLRPEYCDHPETLDRFLKEARHAGALNNPHVAQVYDYGASGPDGSPYLVMEFVNGQSLADALAVDPIEPVLALDIISQAADGLAAAHRAGLVHRDIKPGNILISWEGQVKVADFGIAYAAGQAPVTSPGFVMGTTQYMAPERIAGNQGTAASDVYALGIVLHECLTGMPPHDGTPAEVMAAHLYLPLPPLPADTPPEVDNLVARLTAKDPAQRISDAREVSDLAAMLRDSFSGIPHVARARSAAYPSVEDVDPQVAAFAAGPAPARAGGGGLDSAASSADTVGAVVGAPVTPPPNGPGGPPAYHSGEWPVPPRTPPRRGKLATLAVGAAIAVSAALIALFASGAFDGSSAANQRSTLTPGSASATAGQATSPGSSGATRTSGPTSGATQGGTLPARSGGQATTPGQARSSSPSSSSGGGSSASPTSSSVPSTTPASSVPSEEPSKEPSSQPSSQPTTQNSTPAPSPTPTPTPAPSTCVLGLVCLPL